MSDQREIIRQQAREHARQLNAVRWCSVQDLAERWGIGEDLVRAIPREKLPYLEFGKSNRRRYDPLHVEQYEADQSRGTAA